MSKVATKNDYSRGVSKSSSDQSDYDLTLQKALQRYLRSSALRATPQETFSYYLGKNSTESDHSAFLESLETEFLSNGNHRCEKSEAVKIGIFSLLDALSNNSFNGRPPQLLSLLEESAYQGGNTVTFDYYLGGQRTKEQEQEFRHRLAFIRDIFDCLLDETKTQAVAEYMLGPFQTNQEQSESEEEEQEDENEEEPDEEEEEEEEPEEEEEESDSDSNSDEDGRELKQEKSKKYHKKHDSDEEMTESDEEESEEEESEEEEPQHSKSRSSKQTSSRHSTSNRSREDKNHSPQSHAKTKSRR
jgi:hypothetical protein